VRASFSPEPTTQRTQIDTIVDAIGRAQRSVLFCLFSPTDAALRDACFNAGDKGLMMSGLVNAISARAARTGEDRQRDGATLNASELAAVELYHRSRKNRDVVDGKFFTQATVPDGFDVEMRQFPGEKPPPFPPVIVHHKFVVIDAEGAQPIVYSGSANMSENSEHRNDENLLEIRDARIAAIYLAEFLRLYEHYRARALAIAHTIRGADKTPLRLQSDRTGPTSTTLRGVLNRRRASRYQRQVKEVGASPKRCHHSTTRTSSTNPAGRNPRRHSNPRRHASARSLFRSRQQFRERSCALPPVRSGSSRPLSSLCFVALHDRVP
jgi:hypothetical protein